MANIVIPAYFEIIPDSDGLLGRIVFPNGGKSKILRTKRQALEIGESLVGISIDDIEWKVIKQQIVDSNLTTRNSNIEEIVNEV